MLEPDLQSCLSKPRLLCLPLKGKEKEREGEREEEKESGEGREEWVEGKDEGAGQKNKERKK